MIISKLMGGLGNQMFQYAAGIVLAKHHNVPLKMDNLFLLDKSKRYYRFEHRPYALDIFDISGELATPKEISQFIVPRIGNKYLYHLKQRIFPQKNVVNESSIANYEVLIQLPDHVYLEGYFQKYAYFNEVEREVKKEFTFKDELPVNTQWMVKQINGTCSVCIHIRRGDYVGHPTLDIVGLDYYYKALEILQTKLQYFSIFVFSDDLHWCQQNFQPKQKYEIYFVDQNLAGEKAKDHLQLMTLCEHFIIPNSSYSYWAAFLCKNKNNLIIAPKQWYRGQIEEKNPILPPDWIAI